MEIKIEKELIKKSSEIFDSPEKWTSFLEMKSLSDRIQKNWLEVATRQFREELTIDLPKDWTIMVTENWNSDPGFSYADTATGLQLADFGDKSLVLGFQWCYEFHLYHNVGVSDIGGSESSAKMRGLLGDPHFIKLLDCFKGGSGNKGPNDMAHESRYFFFDSPYDGDIPMDHLPWFAAHRTRSFVDQALAKVRKLTGDPETTELLRELQIAGGIARIDASS